MPHRHKPLPPRKHYARRQARYALFSLLILAFSIGIGMEGYHSFGHLPWVDSFLNASMILTGMGPVDHMDSEAGKMFSAIYAIFSGVAFLTFVAVLFSPAYRRFMHKFHLDIEEGGEDE
jgi:hypothetical protein